MPTLTAARAQYASAMYQELCLNLGTSDMLPRKVELRFMSSILWRKTTALMLLLLFTRPLPRDGGMAENHGAPEAGQLPRFWTRGHKETESRQRVSGAKSP